MKTILCYGDSNTYGYNPSNGMRYPKSIRWTGRLQEMLGEDYVVIEEGCNGRTTVFDDIFEPWKSGLPYLKPCLNTHKPVDIVILMLGSNDLKEAFGASAAQIAEGAGQLVDVILDFTKEKQGFVPEIILVSPPEIGEGIVNSPFFGHFQTDAIDRSREFPKYYGKIAGDKGCIFVNAAERVKASVEDSLHLSPEGHAALAGMLYEAVIRISV
ncbi:MAG: SGNH/GDSL hydrolase family protein [Lachnospiraceae bacterium]|nr:SGNH/GDSL hydrolase family protein [Lachnospiraceae bacterium]